MNAAAASGSTSAGNATWTTPTPTEPPTAGLTPCWLTARDTSSSHATPAISW